MKESASAIDVAGAKPKAQNRLTIGHFLLWMATTSAVLALMQRHKPPSPENIGFASFLHSAAMTQDEVKAEMNKRRQEISQHWRAQHIIGLIFSPVYGAAGAGAVLTTWRILTRRFGFPVQPGHWLLLLIAGFAMLWYVRPDMQAKAIGYNTVMGQDAPDFILALGMTVIAAVTTFFLSNSTRWRMAFLILLVGQTIEVIAYTTLVFSPRTKPPFFFGLGFCADAIFPVLVLLCSAADIADGEHYDIFHWIGVATLFGVAAHFIALCAV